MLFMNDGANIRRLVPSLRSAVASRKGSSVQFVSAERQPEWKYSAISALL